MKINQNDDKASAGHAGKKETIGVKTLQGDPKEPQE